MKHLDLFSGYGGFTIAAQKKSWDTIGHSEIDKYANAVLEYNFNIKNYGSVCDIDFKQFRGEINIITGGTPCQDLSVAEKGAGLEGKRSGLFFEFIRALTESEATYFV
jgi:DNA (cytosine-5)-methyltransferase 1